MSAEREARNSRAVVANGRAQGVALWWSGPDIDCEVDAFGDGLTDLGLDDAPHGVSVWEGHYVYTTVQYFEHTEHEAAPVGTFRAPTGAEWDAIRRGVSPWPDDAAGLQDEAAEVQVPTTADLVSSLPRDAQAGIHVFAVAEFRRAGFQLGALRDEAQAVVQAAQGALDLLAVEPSPAGASKALARLQAAQADLRIDFDDAATLLKGLSGLTRAPTAQPATMAEVVTTAASLGLSAAELGAAVATLQARDPR